MATKKFVFICLCLFYKSS